MTNPSFTPHLAVRYLDHMGSDLSVVNAARASFGTESEWSPLGGLTLRDSKLIRFLADGLSTADLINLDHEIASMSRSSSTSVVDKAMALKRKAQHWAPFAHPQLSIRVQVPLFLARQLSKHQVGAVWSEESRRYISDAPTFYMPEALHSRPANVKQGSGERLGNAAEEYAAGTLASSTVQAFEAYRALLDAGVAPEEARMALPQNAMVTAVWTGSLLFWARCYNQRSDQHAQRAAREFAERLAKIAHPLFPESWGALTGWKP